MVYSSVFAHPKIAAGSTEIFTTIKQIPYIGHLPTF